MCDLHGTDLILTARGHIRGVDACLRALVQHLNDTGIVSYDSCCGHGERYGHITIGEEDVPRARDLGFRLCESTGERRPAYPFSAQDHRVNIILPPVIRSEAAGVA